MGPPGRPCLQRPPAGQHHADHRGGQQLAAPRCAPEGQQRDDIHPHTATAQGICHRPQRVRRSARPSRQPSGIPASPAAGQMPGRASNQARNGHDQQGQRHVPAKRCEFRGMISYIHITDHSPGLRLRPEPMACPPGDLRPGKRGRCRSALTVRASVTFSPTTGDRFRCRPGMRPSPALPPLHCPGNCRRAPACRHQAATCDNQTARPGRALVGMVALGESSRHSSLCRSGLVLTGVVGLNLSGVTP